RLQWNLGEEPAEDEGDGSSPGCCEKDGVECVSDGRHVSGVNGRRKMLERSRVRRGRYLRTGRQIARKVLGELVGEDGAEDCDADRTADLAEESRARTDNAQVLVVDRVLGSEHEHLDHEPEA